MEKNQAIKTFKTKLYTAYYVMLGVLVVLVGVTAVCVRIYPTTNAIRILIVSTLFYCLFVAFLWFANNIYHKPKLIYPVLFLFVSLFVWWRLGSKDIDISALRDAYVSRLEAHIGIKYRYKGETTNGIDSSGLARSSLWQAVLSHGIKEFNPKLLGLEFWKFWFNDIDNKDILDLRHGYTTYIDKLSCIGDYGLQFLSKGDIAITLDRKHLMIYLGDSKWIDADPRVGSVRIFSPDNYTEPDNLCIVPVTIVRWSVLDTGDLRYK